MSTYILTAKCLSVYYCWQAVIGTPTGPVKPRSVPRAVVLLIRYNVSLLNSQEQGSLSLSQDPNVGIQM